MNSLVSYCLLDSNLQIIKNDKYGKLYEKGDDNYGEQDEFVCGDWSLVNSKGKFVKRKECRFSDNRGDLPGFWHTLFPKLKKFYDFKEGTFGVADYVNQFKETTDYFYIDTTNKIRFCILKQKNDEGRNFLIKKLKREIIKGEDGIPIKDENGEDNYRYTEKTIWIVDAQNNRVFDYVLSFYVEKAKRIFAIHKQQSLGSNQQYTEEEIKALLFESVDDLKEGFTSFVIGEIVDIAQRIANDKNKILYIALEDLNNYGNKNTPSSKGSSLLSFKEKEFYKHYSVLVYQKLENALVKKFNYIKTKESKNILNNTQFSPKIKRIEDIKKLQIKGQLGNLLFINPTNTSKQCPVCNSINPKNREKKNLLLDYIVCQNDKCRFSTKENGDKKGFNFINGGDTLAAYNIAKRSASILERVVKKYSKK